MEPDPAGTHSLQVAFPQTPETPWVVQLHLTPGLCRELSQVRNDQVGFVFFFFSSSFPGLLLTQMSSPAWHDEGGDGGKGWQGLRHYQEKKH